MDRTNPFTAAALTGHVKYTQHVIAHSVRLEFADTDAGLEVHLRTDAADGRIHITGALPHEVCTRGVSTQPHVAREHLIEAIGCFYFATHCLSALPNDGLTTPDGHQVPMDWTLQKSLDGHLARLHSRALSVDLSFDADDVLPSLTDLLTLAFTGYLALVVEELAEKVETVQNLAEHLSSMLPRPIR